MKIDTWTFALAVFSCLSAHAYSGEGAQITYEVWFEATWSNSSHPTDFPFNPHFSPLVGGSHNESISFWTPGGIASPGVEQMAETGNRFGLRSEIQSAISTGSAGMEILGDGAGSPGMVSTTFSVSASHPLVTLVTMIAPSPDWFVGVHALELQAEDGLWVPELIVELDPYDSGTDNGLSYASPNSNTNPQAPIRNISDEAPFNANGPLGRFVFTRITQTGCSIADLAAPFGELDIFDVFEFVDGFNANDGSTDLNDDGTHDIFDVFEYLDTFNQGCVI